MNFKKGEIVRFINEVDMLGWERIYVGDCFIVDNFSSENGLKLSGIGGAYDPKDFEKVDILDSFIPQIFNMGDKIAVSYSGVNQEVKIYDNSNYGIKVYVSSPVGGVDIVRTKNIKKRILTDEQKELIGTKCPHCDREITPYNLFHVDDDVRCVQCAFKDNLKRCMECGRYTYNYRESSRGNICEKCISNYEECNDCHQLYRNDSLSEVNIMVNFEVVPIRICNRCEEERFPPKETFRVEGNFKKIKSKSFKENKSRLLVGVEIETYVDNKKVTNSQRRTTPLIGI